MGDLSLQMMTADDAALAPPDEAGRHIDLDHLARMSLGDRALEREVLALFDQQASLLLARIAGSPLPVVAALAHTLKGSARGIGAWPVATAAEWIEMAAARHDTASVASALDGLAAAVAAAQSEIAGLLRAH